MYSILYSVYIYRYIYIYVYIYSWDINYGDNTEDIFGLYIMILGFHEFKWGDPQKLLGF